MKILMMTSRFGFGYGMGYSAYKEAAALVSLGHSVTVLHCYTSPEIADFSDIRINMIYLPMEKSALIGFFLYIFELKELFRKKLNIKDFDCVYIQSLEFGLLDFSSITIPVFYFARSTMRGMRRILQNEGENLPLFAKIVQGVLVALEKRCMRNSKTIFAKSRKMADEISCLYAIPPEKIAIISGGIDDEDFNVQPDSSPATFKRAHGIPEGVPIVLYAGRIVLQKGLSYLIEASITLLQEINFVVVIAGDAVNGSYYETERRKLENTAYKHSFFFLGHVEQRKMSSVFNVADCLVTPSLYEPFGMVNLQAAFLNKNIITTDVTGSVDLLHDYEKLKIVPAGSSKVIESALREVLTSEEKRTKRSFDLRTYSWLNVAKELTQNFFTISE